MTHKIYILIVLFVFLSVVSSSLFNGKSRQKVMLSNTRFHSQTETITKFQLFNIMLQKPLIIILKERGDSSYKFENNTVTLTITAQNSTDICEFNSYDDLCVIPQASYSYYGVIAKCETTPCEINTMAYQLDFNDMQPNQIAQGLFSLQKSNDHMIATVNCNDPEIKNFQDAVKIYSMSHYERGGNKNSINFLFVNQQKGFIYVDVKEQAQQCAHLSIVSSPQKITLSTQQIKDFTTKNSPSSMRMELPKKDFRIDCLLNRMSNADSSVKSITTFNIYGLNSNGNEILIHSTIVKPIYNQKIIRFSVTYKKVVGNYTELRLAIESNQLDMTVINFIVDQYDVHEVELGEKNYFQLKKGEVIKYKLIADMESAAQDQIYFIVQDAAKVKLSKDKCLAFNGCDFEIKAIEDLSSHLYLGSTPKVQDSMEEITFLPLMKSVQKKISDGANIFFKKQIKKGKTFEVMVNSLNVLIYAAPKSKCSIPSEDCYQRAGNFHHPFVYTPSRDEQFRICIQGVGNGEFILTIVEEDDSFIPLTDGHVFSYMLDENEDSIVFKYKLTQKIDVSFNLVAPLNNLLLKVFNGDEVDQDTEYIISTDGDISFLESQINSLQFIIKIDKTELSKKKSTHFTLLATTSQTVVRLQTAVTHYQQMKENDYNQYVFQYNPKEDYIINFYLHNMKDSNISIMLAVSAKRQWNSTDMEQVYINRQSDYLDLDKVSKFLCKKEGAQSCQIFLRLENKMANQVDIAITLMVRDSLIELKDGLWQSYAENSVATTANFYFYPKHYNRNVAILYSTSHSQLRLTYSIWKADSKSINPNEWPFPNPPNQPQNEALSSINHIAIDKDILRSKCQPNCVILITLYRSESATDKMMDKGFFKLLASNNQIQIPQNTRINLAVKYEQKKQILVDLKYILKNKKQMITFYTTHTVGNYYVLGNVISENYQKCPQIGQISDFTLETGETNIEVSFLKERITALGIDSDKNKYICLSIQSLQDCKIALQFTTSSSIQVDPIKKLQMNTFHEISMKKDERGLYQIEPYEDFFVKVMRKRGYPFITFKRCESSKLKDCKDMILSSSDKGNQMVSKTQKFEGTHCQNCIYMMKIQNQKDTSDTIIHIQSKQSQLQLQQNSIITDFLGDDQQNRYTLTGVRGQDLIVNIHVQDGQIEARMTDKRGYDLFKRSTDDNKIIHFFIPGKHSQVEQLLENKDGFNPYQYFDTFINFKLILKNKKTNMPSTFTLTYSSGYNKIYLQDGLITDLAIEDKKNTTFYYVNQEKSKEHIYLTISTKNAADLNSIQIEAYFYLTDQNSNKTKFALEKPQISKKTPSPTLLFLLPAQNFIQIQLINPTNSDIPVSISINHQQVIFLPFEHEYPFNMHPGDENNFLVEVNQPGYVLVTIKKCDESEPTFSYATNYDGFIKKDFNNQIVLTDDPTFEEYIKIKNTGTFYINFKSDQYDGSLLSINLQFVKQKAKKFEYVPGKRGIMDYQILSSSQAEIEFAPLKCGTKPCPNKIKYYVMSSSNLQNLYSQLFCPSHFFSLAETSSLDSQPIDLINIEYQENATKLNYKYSLIDHISYIGVKAVTEDGQQIFYRPIQIVTLWGQLSRTSQTHKITITAIILITIFLMMTYVKHHARKGYRPIEESMD